MKVYYEVIYSYWSHWTHDTKEYRVRRQRRVGKWYRSYKKACEQAKYIRKNAANYCWHQGDRVYVRRMKEGA